MDFVQRLIFLLLFFSPFASFAQYQYYSRDTNGGGPSASEQVAACKASYPNYNMVRADRQGNGYQFNCVYRDSGNQQLYYSGNVYGQNCLAGNSFLTGSCKPDPENCAGKAGNEWPAPAPDGAWNSGQRKSYTFCPQTGGTTTCVVRGGTTYLSASGDNFIAGPWSYTGGTCANDGLGTGLAEAPSSCPKGKCPGTVNGAQVCVACVSVSEQKTTTFSNSGNATSSGGTITTSSGGTSSTATTSCIGNQCTTTTTTQTTNSDGSTGNATVSKTEPKSDFCISNPKAEACKGDGSSWGGSCGAFSCDGDAVTCAIAQASWKSACALDIEPTDSKVQAGNAAITGGDRPAGHPGNNPSSSLFTANLDQTNPYGSACPADIPLNVMGNVVSIPLSSACDTFKFMGQVAVAFTLLAAAFVIFGGVKG